MTPAHRTHLQTAAAVALTVALLGCGGGSGASAPDAAPGPCNSATCPDGCCSGDRCVAGDDLTACGAGGATCASCFGDERADSCGPDGCTCSAEGVRCAEGQVCFDTGCEFCAHSCEGKCAGADNGCGAPCPTNDGCDGCCNAGGACVARPEQSDAVCGAGGDACTDCAMVGESCHDTLNLCTSPLANDADFIAHTAPTQLAPGATAAIQVTMRNSGTATWTAAAGYKLGAQNPQDGTTWGASRVELEPEDAIAPGESKTFTIMLTAPTTPGLYAAQWRMLVEGVEWFGAYTAYAPVLVGGAAPTVCEAARALADTDSDASGAIQGCLDAAAAGAIVELPAGVYRIDGKLEIAAAVTLRTEGTDLAQPPCALIDHACAELAASTAFGDPGGIVQLLAPGAAVDHLVVNGNKAARTATPAGAQCAALVNAYGYNMRVMCDDCAVTNSVTRDALCGTGLEVTGTGSGVTVWRNSVVDNGVHDVQNMWSDGVTVHDYASSTVAANYFRDNSDVDLIFGGCQGCVIQDNRIEHTAAVSGGSFAALMLHAWPDGATSGDFTGTDTSNNVVDCGPSRRCGFGLYLGSDAWYDADTFGGAVHDNRINYAEQGLLIDDAHDMQVYNNGVALPATLTDTSCGPRATGSYGMGTDSFNIDTSRDTTGVTYDDVDWDGCIPNWWN